MHKKIQDLAYARFQYEKPEVEFSTEGLEIEMFREDTYRGSFSFTSINDVPIRGMIYSSDPGMKCLIRDYEGIRMEVPFEFHSGELKEGETRKGEFTIIYNGGEYSLPFVVSVVPFYVMTSFGKVETLSDFVKLAEESYEEAYRIFQSPDFVKLMGEGEIKERLLYQALCNGRFMMQALEEFLIGIGKKQRVTIDIEEVRKNYRDVTEDIRETIGIKKERWGYVELHITSDSKAVEPVKKRITTADFVGNHGDVEFIIRSQELHGGNNYAGITIESLKQTVRCVVCVQMGSGEHSGELKAKKQLLAKITRLYLDFRMQRMVTGVWSKETCICLERLKELEPENLWYVLYQAQALLINRQRQEAEWLFDIFRRKSVKKDSPLYAYYLYLCTLQEQEPCFVAKTASQIARIYQKNQEDIRLFQILLFLDPELNQSHSRKLSAIEEKVSQGMHSPVLYMEAYQLIRHDVYLLKKNGDFERQVLYWAAKEGELTLPVTGRISQYMMQIRQFHPMWYEILKACYRINPQKDLLKTICSFCIKWNLYSREQFGWYDRGVREELRIAGLYEAWMNSAGTEQIEQFPRAVMLYFQYQSNLNEKKQALLYASIIKHKKSQKSLYEAYQKSIERFAVEQLLAGRMDENLAVLYGELGQNSLVDAETALALEKARNTYKLACEELGAVRVAVCSEELKEQVVPLVNGQAYIQLFSEKDCILMENDRGIRYIPTHALILDRLMGEDNNSYGKLERSDHAPAEGEEEQPGNPIVNLLIMAENRMEELDDEADDSLLSLCNEIFEQNIYNERVLWYLCCYYKGNIRKLEQLWMAAGEFELPTYELEERFLTQLLYTEGHTEKMEEIFRSYYDSRGQELILMACLSYFSYQYFVKNVFIKDAVFECLGQQIMLGNSMNDCCRLAYFKWLAGEKNLSEKQEKLLEGLLRENLKKQMYFAFYGELPEKLLRKYHLYDKVILEYRTNPGYRVTVRYRYAETGYAETVEVQENAAAEMTHMYEGIFARPFVVFCGEEILYQIAEETADKSLSTENGCLRSIEKTGSDDVCAYDMLNAMLTDIQEKDWKRLQKRYHQYRRIKQQTEGSFKPL